MSVYLCANRAIIDMNARGFKLEFQILGNVLYCVLEESFIRVSSFVIVEYHKFYRHLNEPDGMVIFGIIAPYEQKKGMLLTRNYSTLIRKSPVIKKKLIDLHDRITYRYYL